MKCKACSSWSKMKEDSYWCAHSLHEWGSDDVFESRNRFMWNTTLASVVMTWSNYQYSCPEKRFFLRRRTLIYRLGKVRIWSTSEWFIFWFGLLTLWLCFFACPDHCSLSSISRKPNECNHAIKLRLKSIYKCTVILTRKLSFGSLIWQSL